LNNLSDEFPVKAVTYWGEYSGCKTLMEYATNVFLLEECDNQLKLSRPFQGLG
jgi:hypothetical protein